MMRMKQLNHVFNTSEILASVSRNYRQPPSILYGAEDFVEKKNKVKSLELHPPTHSYSPDFSS